MIYYLVFNFILKILNSQDFLMIMKGLTKSMDSDLFTINLNYEVMVKLMKNLIFFLSYFI